MGALRLTRVLVPWYAQRIGWKKQKHMKGVERTVSRHYQVGDLMRSIHDGLHAIGKRTDALGVDDLAPLDAFHTRGRAATEELAALALPSASDHVLDVGCGLGGSARYLADRFGCRVTGVDVTSEYIEVAKRLTAMVGLQSKIDLKLGSAVELPFDDQRFDIVITEHVQMNVRAKPQFYAEIARVLRPGGRLVIHDIFAAQGAPRYPLPWAEDSSISFLIAEDHARNMLADAGLRIRHWENKVDEALAFLDSVLTKIAAKGAPPIGIHLLMGKTAKQKLSNYREALLRGQLTVCIGLAEKVPS